MIINGNDFWQNELQTKKAIIEEGCLTHLQQLMEGMSIQGKSTLVMDTNVAKATSEIHTEADQTLVLPAENLHATRQAVEMLESMLDNDARVLIALGSGTVHDIVRYVAAKRHLDFVSCPTAASVDGFCSSVAAMTWDGFKKTVTAVAPSLVVADLNIISKAPLRLARSGMGDMLGKFISLADWKIANVVTGEKIDKQACILMQNALDDVIQSADGITQSNSQAYGSLMKGLLLSGIAMQAVGNSRPASGAEHHISHLIEIAGESFGVSRETLHGERVGVGTLIIANHYQNALKNKPAFHDRMPMDKAMYKALFSSSAEKLIEENANDCLSDVTIATLQETWPTIEEIVKTVPGYESLKGLFSDLGLLSTLDDIGIKEERKKEIIDFSPYMRNRLTFNRMLSQFCSFQ